MDMENFDEIVMRARLRRKRERDGRLENFVALLFAGVELKMPQLFPIEERPISVKESFQKIPT